MLTVQVPGSGMPTPRILTEFFLSWSDAEKYVTFAAAGKGVNNGETGTMNIRDLAAIILFPFDIDAPDFDEKGWTSQIPKGLFKDSNSNYRDISHLTGAAPRISKTRHTSELI